MAVLSDWPWRHWSRIRPEQIAMITDGRHLSWAQLAQLIEEMAAGFISQGVHAGSGVAMKAVNSESSLLAYLALLQCGARLLPLNPQLPLSQMTALLPLLDIDFALTLSGDPLPDITALTLQRQARRVEHHWEPAALATLTLTSGSVGLPKAAVHTFRAHLASAHGVVTKMNFTAEDRWLLSLPVCHVSGQGIIWRWLVVGACLVLPGSALLSQALELATFASLVPTQLWRLLQQPPLPRSLRKVLLGGAVIPPALTQLVEEAGIACWCGYGMTETASTVTAKRADVHGGVGQPLAGQRLRVVDGEVHIQSAALACGYWRQGHLLPLTSDDGWFATRDGGYLDDDGLHLVGRLDNQFFSAGEGIQPEQVEAVLLAHPGVEQLFIVPKGDPEFGHRPVALVKLKAGTTLAELEAWSTTRLAGFQRPVKWYMLPDLHHGGIKVSRQQLAAWVEKQEQRVNAQ